MERVVVMMVVDIIIIIIIIIITIIINNIISRCIRMGVGNLDLILLSVKVGAESDL